MRLQLDVWREACRHIEIDQSVARLAPILNRRLPLDLMLMRRIDLQHARLDTVAIGGTWSARPSRARTELTRAALDALVAWCREGKALLGATQEATSLIESLVPAGLRGNLLIGPLATAEGPIGVVVLVAQPPRRFTGEHAEILEELLEPFAVALENDRHLHELARLREAVEADNRALLNRLGRQEIVDSIVGSDAGLRMVMERVEQVAPTDAPALILGETGSGKEVVARAIHNRSRRATGPIVRVNCGAIPPELVDSELFGHERGSFTGAVNARKGWFERADGGTLFLDEIGELPLAAQVRLLRILQDGSFERVGGHRTLTVDVRIVAATHRDLQAMVAAGQFRQDLWYRISVFPIRLPPLRERLEDIPALAAHFAWRAGLRLGGAPLVPTPADIDQLVGYSWPGNVRELAAVIERAAILGDGRRLEIAAALGTTQRPHVAEGFGSMPLSEPVPVSAPVISSGLRAPITPFAAAALQPGQNSQPFAPLPGRPILAPAPEPSSTGGSQDDLSSLDAAMVRHIEQALALTRGRIEGPHGAAALLGINPHTLRARMRKLGIHWERFRPGREGNSLTG